MPRVKMDSENLGARKVFMDTSEQYGCQEIYPFARGRRVLCDSGNLPYNDNLPKPWKKTKQQKSKVPANKKASKLKGFFWPTVRKVLGDGEPMEVGFDNTIQRMLIRLPAGVVDIDSSVRDHLLCPHYAQDIINYAQCAEQRWVLPTDFYETDNPDLKTSMRSVLIDWLIQVQDHLGLQQETLHLSIGLMDRYLNQNHVALEKLQLLGIATLFVASKFIERFSPEVEVLIHLTDNTYTYTDVIHTEMKILKALHFDLSLPTPMFFLDRFLLVEKTDDEEAVANACRYLLDLTLTNLPMVQFSSSLKAASALYISRYLFARVSWSAGLAYYSKFSAKDLKPCLVNMVTALSNVSRSRLQAAKIKYSSVSRFNNVSSDERLTNRQILQDVLQHSSPWR